MTQAMPDTNPDSQMSIIAMCQAELDRLETNIEAITVKLEPLRNMNAVDISPVPEEAPRHRLHAVELRIRALNNRLNALIYEIEV